MSKQEKPTHKVVSLHNAQSAVPGEMTWRTGTLEECEDYARKFRILFANTSDVFVVQPID
jgi:hypothetical protein